MRALFWRRKNARLATRLNTLVETSERVRKGRARKPRRVVIDTSYVEQEAAEADWNDAEYVTETGAVVEPEQGNAHDAPALSAPYQGADDDTDPYDDTEADQGDEADDETTAILREAVEQLDRAEASEAEALDREAAALAEIEVQRERLAQLAADFAQEQQARAQAEQALEEAGTRHGEPDDAEPHAEEQAATLAAAEQELEAQCRLVEDLNAELELERQEREQANTERDAAIARAAATEVKLAELSELEADLADAVSRAEAAEAQVATLTAASSPDQERLAEFENDLAAARTARADADAATAGARQQAEDLAQQLEEAQHAADVRASDAETRAMAAQAEADEQSALAAKLAAEVAELGSALAEQRDAQAASAERTEAAERELANVHALNDALDVAKQRIADAEARDNAARGEAKAQAAAIRRLDGEVKTLRAALEEAEEEIEETTQRAQTAEDALADRTAKDDGAFDIASQTPADRDEGDRAAVAIAEERCAALTDELEDLRMALASANARSEAAETRVRENEQEAADLNELEAQRSEVEQRCADAEQRAAEAQAEVEAERERYVDIKAELERERAAREAMQADLDAARHTQAKDTSADDHVAVVSEAVPDTAAPKRGAQSVPQQDDTRVVPAKSSTSKARSVQGKAKKTAPKRTQRIAAKTKTETADTSTGSVAPSRVESVIQKRIAKATTEKAKTDEGRRARRVSSRKLASLWQEGMSAPLSCTILDRSSTGAKVEVLTDRFNTSMNDISVGDRFTVTQTFAHERTSVLGEIIWVDGQQCGVRYCGQILTEVQKPAKKKKAAAKAAEKPSTGKAIKSLFTAGTR